MIDKIYCINLDSRKDRWKEFISQSEIKLLGRIDRFSGRQYKNINPYIIYRSKLKPGEIGCLMSHLTILEQSVYDKSSNILVLEDDAVFAEGAVKKIKEYLSIVNNNYSICYLGGNYIHDRQSSTISDHDSYISCTDILSTVGYLINTKCILSVIKLIKRRMFSLPIDEIYCEYQRMSECHMLAPRVVYQRPGYSDICKGFRNYSRMRDF